MVPRIITDASITFIAQGQPWVLAGDHANFGEVRRLLEEGCEDEARLVALADVRVAVSDATLGRAQLTEEGLFLDGEQLGAAWADVATSAPSELKVLLVSPGDRVRVEGDEDAPDGVYTVGDIDNEDTGKRIYVESEDDYFGFVANASIKEILRD